MKLILSLLLIIVVTFIGAFFYLRQPKNLGVTYTQADLKSIYGKLKVTFEPLPTNAGTEKTLIVSGSHPVDANFSSQELTAAVDNRRKNYIYFPFRNVQIRVNPDGSVEGAGTVNFQDAVNYLVALGVSYQDIAKAAAKFKVPNADLPVYLKVSGSILNNLGHLSVESASIVNIPVPQGLVNQYGPAINDLVESVIKDRQPSYNIEKLEVVNGKVHFKGTSPDKEQAVRSL
ncbi:hypothetical protein HZA76_02525 [Candidatus Roizmanbacteria bacterium]|nr:hypothetical protein [Candidatus Roizmanbacteria bacterium]